jgi:hypothetical protein
MADEEKSHEVEKAANGRKSLLRRVLEITVMFVAVFGAGASLLQAWTLLPYRVNQLEVYVARAQVENQTVVQALARIEERADTISKWIVRADEENVRRQKDALEMARVLIRIEGRLLSTEVGFARVESENKVRDTERHLIQQALTRIEERVENNGKALERHEQRSQPIKGSSSVSQ